jgi:MFS family permease
MSGPAFQWAVTGYALAFSGPLLLCGRAADLLGRRRMFAAGMALRILASLLCGLAPSLGVLVAARALQGISAAIIAPAALSMVMNTFPEGAGRNKALGIWGGLGGLGATAGLLLGGLVTDTLGWQWVFWINIPVGAAVLALVPVLLPESRTARGGRSFNVSGVLTITPALVLLVYGITQAPAAGWSSPHTTAPLAAAAMLGCLFVLTEKRAAAPLIPLRLLRSRPLAGGSLLLLIAGMSVDGMLVTLTGYAQQVLGWSALHFGMVAAVMTAASIAGALISQRAVTSLGVQRVTVAGAALLGGACLLLTRLPAGSLGLLLAALLAFGAGMGALAVGSQIAALTGVPEKDSGTVAGLADTCFAIGTALGTAICVSIAAHRTTAAGRVIAAGRPAATALTSGQHAAFAAASTFALLGLLTALGLLRSPDSAHSPDASSTTPPQQPHHSITPAHPPRQGHRAGRGQRSGRGKEGNVAGCGTSHVQPEQRHGLPAARGHRQQQLRHADVEGADRGNTAAPSTASHGCRYPRSQPQPENSSRKPLNGHGAQIPRL